MAAITPISAQCSACQEDVELRIVTKLVSPKAPPGTAVLFIEVDPSALERHTAGHEADDHEIAA